MFICSLFLVFCNTSMIITITSAASSTANISATTDTNLQTLNLIFVQIFPNLLIFFSISFMDYYYLYI